MLELDPFYLNERRLAQLVGPEAMGRAASRIGHRSSDKALRTAELAIYARLVRDWLMQADAATPIEVLWSRGQVEIGRLFTVHRDFNCRGVNGVSVRSASPALMHATYPDFADGSPLRLELRLNREHLAPGSPGELLTGHVGSVFALGIVHAVTSEAIVGVPIFVGRQMSNPAGAWAQWLSWDSCEVHLDEIDSFSQARGQPIRRDLATLKSVPEEAVKVAIAEIIGEPFVPKDWGGERSDMFTAHLRLGGRRVSAAFAFKGPAKFRPLTLAEMGKNGDQIDRLATEPADLLVVQHCHRVTGPIRTMLRAFCNQVANNRRFCILDGVDTLRLLRAYGKCGLGPMP